MAYDDSLIRIRFIGDSLQTRSVPVYELGQALIALQRLIHKAHLSKTQRLTRSNFPSKEERIALAMQLGERRRASDGYALVPVHDDSLPHLSELTEFALRNVFAYGSVRDFDRFQNIEDDRKLYIINIYNQVADLANRIGNIGGIESIEIAGRTPTPIPTVYITQETIQLVKEVKGRLVRGPLMCIEGEVSELNPATNTVRIYLQDAGRFVAIRLTPHQFHEVRYSQIQNPRIFVTGWPLHKMGVESLKFESFDSQHLAFEPQT